jgi:hypothetical protein
MGADRISFAIPFPANGSPLWQRILRVTAEVHNKKEVGHDKRRQTQAAPSDR